MEQNYVTVTLCTLHISTDSGVGALHHFKVRTDRQMQLNAPSTEMQKMPDW